MRGSGRGRQRGQSMVEYTVVVSILVAALLTAGRGSMDDVEEALRGHNRAYTYALSLSTYPNSEDLTELAQQYAEDNIDPAELQAALDPDGYTDALAQYLTGSFPVSLQPQPVDVDLDDIRDFIGF